MEKKTLRAQACRFRRHLVMSKDPGDWEPGIAFLEAFGVADVDFIIDYNGKMIAPNRLYNYELLQLRVDGYIAIEPHDYVGKVSKEDLADYGSSGHYL